MTRRLREDRNRLAEVLEALEGLTKLPFAQLEKDFWLTEALRGVAETADEMCVPVYFKGGTSLSKVFGIIERFSEDVDVLVGLPKTDERMSANRRNTVLKELVRGAERTTGLKAQTDPGKSRKGDKRAAYLAYSENDESSSLQPLRPEGVLIELGRWGGSQPHDKADVRSLLAEHAQDLDLEPFDEQAPVTINVVNPVRTAVEKLVLLENAAADPDERRRQMVARHYYDVWCLLHHETTSAQLRRPDLVAEIAGEVFVYTHYFKRADHKDSLRERPPNGFSSSAAFEPDNPVLAVTRAAYHATVINGLLWPNAKFRPSFEECCEAVATFSGGL